ncbi:MAG TPA: HU family DNA-binding protein [Cyclobacteriaceae bacterium]
MNKADLINSMADQAGITKAQATKALDSLLDAIVKDVSHGNSVTLVNFGTFSQSKRKSRKVRNPQTGQEITVPEKVVPKFKPGKSFISEVEKG